MKISHETSGISPDFLGNELEQAYSEVFGATRVGGHHDGGIDLIDISSQIPFIQVKSSWKGALEHLGVSLKRKKFIPVVVGEPGTKEEMLKSLMKYGGWVAHDIPNRMKDLENIAKAREMCYA